MYYYSHIPHFSGDKRESNMSIRINRVTVFADEIANGVFAVIAKSLGGEWFQHNGPVEADYFTEAQASEVVRETQIAGQIDAARWTCGTGGYFGSFDHEVAMIEAELIEG